VLILATGILITQTSCEGRVYLQSGPKKQKRKHLPNNQ